MTRGVEVDYLVVGAGATGMAFTDALIDHADVRVALVDRRLGVGGHWLEAYPFVRLHQSSTFYGVASTVLGGGRIQERGPEAGLHERADQRTICAYYQDVLVDRLLGSGRVELFTGCEYAGGGTFVATASGERFEVSERCRIVDARYLAPDIPAETPPRFAVEDGAWVIPVNDLVRSEEVASQYVVVGSGKTATDACIWLLGRGVDPDTICWVRPREPWMLNRALIQPDPVVYLGMVADLMRSAEEASSLPEVFLRLEEAGIMHRLDRSVVPTMAKAPTLGVWELEQLRTIEHVVRRGHIDTVGRGRIALAQGSVAVADDAVVVNCAADGLKMRPRLPIWGTDAITLQPVRAGFPCFGAALIGYVEATRRDDEEKNRLCPPSSYGNSLEDWARMNVLGTRASASFGSEPDIAAWANRVALNPARIPPEHGPSAELDDVLARLQRHTPRGVANLARLGGRPSCDVRAGPERGVGRGLWSWKTAGEKVHRRRDGCGMTASRSARQRKASAEAGDVATVRIDLGDDDQFVYKISCTVCVVRGDVSWSAYRPGADNGFMAAMDRWTFHLHEAHPDADAPCLAYLPAAQQRLQTRRDQAAG